MLIEGSMEFGMLVFGCSHFGGVVLFCLLSFFIFEFNTLG